MHVLVESGSIRLKGTQIRMNEPNANTEVEKLDLSSLDVAELKRQELVELFPEVRTEGGKIDFERLKAMLGEMVDAGRERYGMNWPGKAECMRTIQAPSMGTLLPMPDESVDWDTTENVIIEGDNLEVLKLLQKSYLGKIKMIYIDPPYNTGGDFIYPDNFTESLQTYLEYTGQVDSNGRKFGTNSDSEGRFHSKWINMLYPRLFLAKNLLREDGAIFISIGEDELPNLRKVGEEIFGEENYVATFVWDGGRKNDSKKVSIGHEYIVVFSKRPDQGSGEDSNLWKERKEGIDEIYKVLAKARKEFGTDFSKVSGALQDWYRGIPESHPAKAHEHYRYADAQGVYFASDLSGPDDGRKNRPRYEVLHPVTKRPVPVPARGWRWEEPRMRDEIARGRVHFGPDESSIPNGKVYLKENEWQAPSSVFYKDRRAASSALKALMGEKVFDFPKDTTILSKMISLLCRDGDIVLDFFAGSGSTAEATLRLSAARNMKINFILVQLPEPIEEGGRAWQKGFRTISDIAVERIRRVSAELTSASKQQLDFKLADYGYRHFRLAPSNFIPWDGTASNDAEQLAKQLKLGIDHTRGDRTPQDLLFEVLLKSWGEPALSLKVGEETIEGVRVFSIAEGAFLICLEEKVTLEFIRALAARKPDRVVMRESAFAGNDQLKTNAVQTFKSQGVTSFKVV